ncbi:MAG TPA: metalloregulator ArsR/SmtB family transcription factor [Devosiaceae bacterium]
MLNNPDPLDQLFHALADANRRAIIDRLAREEVSVSALRGPLGISMPATLQHIGVLEAAGLVTTRKKGRVRTCTLDRTALSRAEKWINERREFWSDRLDALGHHLEGSMNDFNERGDKT